MALLHLIILIAVLTLTGTASLHTAPMVELAKFMVLSSLFAPVLCGDSQDGNKEHFISHKFSNRAHALTAWRAAREVGASANAASASQDCWVADSFGQDRYKHEVSQELLPGLMQPVSDGLRRQWRDEREQRRLNRTSSENYSGDENKSRDVALTHAVVHACRPKDANNTSVHLHGENHPAVSIRALHPVYEFDQFGVKALELDLWVTGCVVGLKYVVVVEGVGLDVNTAFLNVEAASLVRNREWRQQFVQVSDTGTSGVTAVFRNPDVNRQYTFWLRIEEIWPELSAEKQSPLSALTVTFQAPFATKHSVSMVIQAVAPNAPVFAAIRLRNFSDPILARRPAIEMAQTCTNPLSYLNSVFGQAHATRSTLDSSCIITGFDESHEDEGMLMVLGMLTACHKTRFLIYNMGMSQEALQLLSIKFTIEIYDPPVQMPDYARRFERGNKSFKPIVIADAILVQGCTRGLWGDSSVRHKSLCHNGTLPSLHPLSLHWGGQDGIHNYTGANHEYTHPDTYQYFLTERSENKHLQFETNLVVFDMALPLWEDILCRWLYCALHKQCILPDGAIINALLSKWKEIDKVIYKVHRDDQSALNLALVDAVRISGSNFNVGKLNYCLTVARESTVTQHEKVQLTDYLISSSRGQRVAT